MQEKMKEAIFETTIGFTLLYLLASLAHLIFGKYWASRIIATLAIAYFAFCSYRGFQVLR